MTRAEAMNELRECALYRYENSSEMRNRLKQHSDIFLALSKALDDMEKLDDLEKNDRVILILNGIIDRMKKLLKDEKLPTDLELEFNYAMGKAIEIVEEALNGYKA